MYVSIIERGNLFFGRYLCLVSHVLCVFLIELILFRETLSKHRLLLCIREKLAWTKSQFILLPDVYLPLTVNLAIILNYKIVEKFSTKEDRSKLYYLKNVTNKV